MTLASDSDLRLNIEPTKLLHSINDRIRKLLELPDILKVVVEELRLFLATDRVMVYKFHADNNGQVIAESINENKLPSLLNLNFPADEIPAHASELFVPILYDDQLWGLLVSHHSQPRSISNVEVDTVQTVADLLGVVIAYITPLQDARLKAHRETIINRIADRLHLLPDMDLQTALEETVTAFDGCGGRLCIRSDVTYQADTLQSFIECLTDATKIKVYQFGKQPVVPKIAKFDIIEQYSAWEEHYKKDYCVWAISDIYQTPELRNLQIAFQATNIRGLLMIPLLYRNELQGYLSVFRDSYESETRQSKQLQAKQWTCDEITFAASIGHQFATATYEYELYQKVNYFNFNLESQVLKRTLELTTTLQELKQTQTQLIQTEKMSSLGQLVAGIAHEINNPVNFIYGNINHVHQYVDDILGILDLYQQNCSTDIPEVIERAEEVDLNFIVEDLPKMLSSIKLGTDRIRQIVLSLRNFSRLDQAEIKPVNIHEGIDSTLVILQHRLKAKPESPAICIIKKYGHLPPVECYAGQINQVFMNVLSNAIDALETYRESHSESQNKISITTSISTLPDNRPSVLISIADNGCGMPQNIIEKIFDPFFTTKDVGQGTGLGLSISYQIIVDKHNGTFKCKSQPGEGTEFLIQIPIKVRS